MNCSTDCVPCRKSSRLFQNQWSIATYRLHWSVGDAHLCDHLPQLSQVPLGLLAPHLSATHLLPASHPCGHHGAQRAPGEAGAWVVTPGTQPCHLGQAQGGGEGHSGGILQI